MQSRIKYLIAAASISASLAGFAVEQCPLPRRSVKSKDEALALAKRVVKSYKLTNLTLPCLDFGIDKQHTGPGYELDVREIHSKECGGDEMTAPRVMSINIKSNGYVTTTGYTMGSDMAYRPLVCKRNKHDSSKSHLKS